VRPTAIEFRGLKSRDRTLSLGNLNLLLGAVGSGKSAVEQALQFAFLGHVPSIGKSEQSTGRLMRGDEIYVRVVLDDGRHFVRALRRDHHRTGPRYRMIASCSWLPEDTGATEAGVEITKLVGANDVDATENLHLGALLSATPNERARRITALLDSSGMSPDELVSRGRLLFRARLGSTCPATSAEIGEGDFGLVTAAVRDVAPQVADELGAELRTGGVGKAEEAMSGRKRGTGEDSRSKRAARTEIEAQLHGLSAPAEAMADLRDRRDAVLAAVAAARQDVSAHDSAFTLRRSAEEQLVAFRSLALAAQTTLDEAMARVPEVAELRARATTIEDPPEIAAPVAVEVDANELRAADELDARALLVVDPPMVERPPVVLPDFAEAERKEAEARSMEAQATAIVAPEPLFCGPATAAKRAAEEALSLAKRSPWRTVEAIAADIEAKSELEPKINAFDPDVLVMAEEISALRALAKIHGGDTGALEFALGIATQGHQEAEAAFLARADERDKAFGSIEALRTSASDLRRQAIALRKASQDAADATNRDFALAHTAAVQSRSETLALRNAERKALRDAAKGTREAAQRKAANENATARSSHAAQVQARHAILARNAETRTNLRAQATEIERAVAVAQTQRDAAAADVRTAEARLSGIASVSVDVEAAQRVIVEAGPAVADLDAKIKVVEGAEALRAQMRDLLREIDAADAANRAYAAAENACQSLRGEDMAKRSKGLEARMREFLVGAGRSEEPYIRAGKGQLDFGWRRDGREISVEALSGGEAVIFCAAMAAAIVSLRSAPVKVLLLEAAELGSAEPAIQVLRGCEAIAIHLDLVTVATNASITGPERWTVADMSRQTVGVG